MIMVCHGHCLEYSRSAYNHSPELPVLPESKHSHVKQGRFYTVNKTAEMICE